MKNVSHETIAQKVCDAICEISLNCDEDVKKLIKEALDKEDSPIVRDALKSLVQNHELSPASRVPLCQDTGTTVVFAELGNNVRIIGATLFEAIEQGVIAAQKSLPMRASMYKDPLFNRENSGDNSPPILHIEHTHGDSLTLHIAQKGGGAENKSFMQMFTPSTTADDIIEYVINGVVNAGSQPCPPLVIGVGIGGNFEQAPLLAKRALMRKLALPHLLPQYSQMEAKILEGINKRGCGIQGLGGDLTAMAVHINTAPCHIASLPVAVNIDCHAHRHCTLRF